MNTRCAYWAAGIALALSVGVARAGFYTDLYQGLEYFATPLGSPLTSLADGSRINGSRLGRVRVVPNLAGDGYRLELDRTFGPDSQGRPEVLDLGAFELELAGDTQATLSYTKRGGFVTGNADLIATDLTYRTAVKTGAIDATLTGTLNIDNALEVNQFGFYTMNINIDNDNAELVYDTISDYESEEIDFSVGPITVRGNIYFDLFVALLDGLGLDTSDLAALSPKSPIDQINGALNDSLTAAGLAPAKAFDGLGDGSAKLFAFSASELMGEEAIDVDAAQLAPSAEETDPAQTAITPEPSAALLLLGLVGMACGRRR